MILTIENTFQVPVWDEFTSYKTLRFWKRRGFEFIDARENMLSAKRGSLLGNFISFDMSDLMSKLTINVSAENEIRCALRVNTFMQFITEYNRAWWNLEMEMFESFLIETDEQDERWEKFLVNHKKASIVWALSAGFAGNKMPPGEKP